jgi:hypothetical protein
VTSTLFVLSYHGRVDWKVNSLFETSVKHRLESVGGGVQITSVEQWQARSTKVVVVTNLSGCQLQAQIFIAS